MNKDKRSIEGKKTNRKIDGKKYITRKRDIQKDYRQTKRKKTQQERKIKERET